VVSPIIETSKEMENKMDSMEKFYAKREEDFWTYYNKIKSYADNADVDVYQVVNFRQIFDQAYTLGALQNSKKDDN
jgi:Tfp pilus assembly protein PilE